MSYFINEAAQGMGLKKKFVGGEDIGDHKLVYIASNGKCYHTNADSVSTMPVVGISCGAFSSESEGEILFLGLIKSDGWNWTTGGGNGMLYASTSAGELTQTKPVSTGNQVQIVGIVITETLILFNPNYVVVEVK